MRTFVALPSIDAWIVALGVAVRVACRDCQGSGEVEHSCPVWGCTHDESLSPCRACRGEGTTVVAVGAAGAVGPLSARSA